MSQLDPNNRSGGLSRKFRKDRQNGMMLGVCSGIARYFGWDPLVVRLAFVLGTVLGFGSFIIVYLAIALLAD